MIRIFCVSCAVLLAFVRPVPAEPDSVEARIVERIASRRDDALALLRVAVDQNSGTMNFDGVRAVGTLFRAEFDAIGCETEWIDGATFGRAGHLVARRGERGPHFLLIGHLDTVFEPSSPFQSYELLDPDHARGPGVTDMKGGNVIILEVLRALDAAGLSDRFRVTVVLTGDEERSGQPIELARAALVDAAKDADYAFGFEDGDGDPSTAVISRRGSESWRLEVEGTPAHSSQVFSESVGYGAIFEMARILDRFRSELAGQSFLTFNPGLALGGTDVEFDSRSSAGSAFGKSNVVAATAVATGDLRTISPEQLAAARATMESIVDDSLPGTSATLRFAPGYPPLAPTEGNRDLLSMYDQVSRDLGHGPVAAVDPMRAGAADVSFTSGLVEGALCGLGLMGTGGHTTEETAALRTLGSQAERAAVLFHRLIRMHEASNPGE